VNIFPKKPTICGVCRVYYEPIDMHARWPDLCPTHRERPMTRDLLRDAVLGWAAEHWEQLIGVINATDPDGALEIGLEPLYAAARDAGGFVTPSLSIEHTPPDPRPHTRETPPDPPTSTLDSAAPFCHTVAERHTHDPE